MLRHIANLSSYIVFHFVLGAQEFYCHEDNVDLIQRFKTTYILGPLSDENSQWNTSICGLTTETG